jgi:hypothetical protein
MTCLGQRLCLITEINDSYYLSITYVFFRVISPNYLAKYF